MERGDGAQVPRLEEPAVETAREGTAAHLHEDGVQCDSAGRQLPAQRVTALHGQAVVGALHAEGERTGGERGSERRHAGVAGLPLLSLADVHPGPQLPEPRDDSRRASGIAAPPSVPRRTVGTCHPRSSCYGASTASPPSGRSCARFTHNLLKLFRAGATGALALRVGGQARCAGCTASPATHPVGALDVALAALGQHAGRVA